MIFRIIKSLVPVSIKSKIRHGLYKKFGCLSVSRHYEICLLANGRFKDQVAVVTGGSGALGRAICCRLAAEGAYVYVCGTTDHKIKAVVNEIEGMGGMAFPCKLNVKDEKDIAEKFATIADQQGHIDILVTSAGGSARELHNDISEQDPEVIRDVVDVNLTGTIMCAQQAAKRMIKQGNGKIIAIGSTIGCQGRAGYSEYAAAKGGVAVFVKSLAMELGGYGINVNCVSPGIIQRDRITASQMKSIKKTNYMKGYGKFEDISSMIAFLVSEEASFITGQNIIVDGGRSLGLKGS